METAWAGFELTLSWNKVLGLSNIGRVGREPTRVEHLLHSGMLLQDWEKFFVKLSADFCSNYTLLLALVTLGDTNINPIRVLSLKVTKVSRGVYLRPKLF